MLKNPGSRIFIYEKISKINFSSYSYDNKFITCACH